MAMLDSFAPIPIRKKMYSNIPILYKKEIAYVVEKISFIDENIEDTYYKLLFIKFFIENNKIKIQTFFNNFQLFSNDFYITFLPEGELIVNKDIEKIDDLSLLKIKSINNMISKKINNKINLVKKDNSKLYSIYLTFVKFFNCLKKHIK